MEIYKLEDEVLEKRRARNNSSATNELRDQDDGLASSLRITDMKMGVKNLNRVNVYVNGRFEFSLDVAQVVDYGLKVGLVLNEKRLLELRRASEFGKLYQRTLEWVLMRPRAVRETKDYLTRKLRSASRGPSATDEERGSETPPVTTGGRERVREEHAEFSRMIVERLCDKGYLDDRRFAEWYVENRFVKKGVSRKRLKMELVKKGVATDIIDEVLSGRDDEEEVRKMIARKKAKYNDPQKLIAYLCRQGFSYDLVRGLVEIEEE